MAESTDSLTQAAQSRVFVDGNNVMGSRPDGLWRDRAEAARRLVAEIIPLALGHGGAWTIAFDGKELPAMPLPPECLTVIHTGHGRPNGADDRIVEFVDALPNWAASLVYTSDAKLRTRVEAFGTQVVGSRTNRTARSRSSGEYLFECFMCPVSQGLEPPRNQGRFKLGVWTLNLFIGREERGAHE